MLSIFLVLAAVVIVIWNFDIAKPQSYGESTFLWSRLSYQSWRRLRRNIDEIGYCWLVFASIMSPFLLLEPAGFWTERALWKNPEGVFLVTFLVIAIVCSIVYLACLIFKAANEVKQENNGSKSKFASQTESGS